MIFDLNPALQAACECDTSIARVTGCVYPRREGYYSRSVTDSPANARVKRTRKTFSLVLHTETV